MWGSTPFGSRNAWVDLTGMIQQFHVALAPKVFALTQRTYPLLPLGTTTMSPVWLAALQTQCDAAGEALGIGRAPDLQSYDLADPTDWASWTFNMGQFHRALAVAAGL
jgi:hypothetical protein